MATSAATPSATTAGMLGRNASCRIASSSGMPASTSMEGGGVDTLRREANSRGSSRERGESASRGRHTRPALPGVLGKDGQRKAQMPHMTAGADCAGAKKRARAALTHRQRRGAVWTLRRTAQQTVDEEAWSCYHRLRRAGARQQLAQVCATWTSRQPAQVQTTSGREPHKYGGQRV